MQLKCSKTSVNCTHKYTHQLIGYVDLGDPQLNFSTFNDCNALASYILVFDLRGILCDFEFATAYFATKGATPYQIFPLFWDAAAILEGTCNLKFITGYIITYNLIKILIVI